METPHCILRRLWSRRRSQSCYWKPAST